MTLIKLCGIRKLEILTRDKFRRGWMLPHPTFFCKKVVYDRYGLLNLDFPLAADYEPNAFKRILQKILDNIPSGRL